jgi:regulator of sigma E protease
MPYLVHLLEAMVAINLLVLVHEAGHLLTAGAFRVPALRFSLGLGPRLFGFTYKGTDYCLSAVPIGGFVQLAKGHRHGPGTACMDCVDPWKRMLVFLSGPLANLLLVVFLFWLAYCLVGWKDHEPVIAAVDPGSREAFAGLEAGDRIVRADGRRVIAWSQVELALLAEDRGPVALEVLAREGPEGPGGRRQERTRLLDVSLEGQAALGILPGGRMIRLRLGPGRALVKSVDKLRLLSRLVADSLVGLAAARIPPSELVGPVYLFHLSSEAASAGGSSLLSLLAFVSASLCFFNLLPLPVLDGGQIVLAFLEKVLNRPIGDRSLRLLMHASVFWLLLLLASATLNDLVRLLAP